MTWYLAPSLSILRAEVNVRWPERDTRSDGTIGDAAHQSTTSDHNPNSRGSVNAWDMDVDGVSPETVKRAFERHPWAHYWIHDERIADADNDWRPLYYGGSNPHRAHVHFSIRQNVAAEQDLRSWGLLPTTEVDMTDEEMRANVVIAVHSLLDQMANRSTPTGRQAADDFYQIVTFALQPSLNAAKNEILAAIQATVSTNPAAFAAALAESPAALNALTSAMRDQLPLIPTAQETAKAFIAAISAGLHNGH
jgi:hypothetical protein